MANRYVFLLNHSHKSPWTSLFVVCWILSFHRSFFQAIFQSLLINISTHFNLLVKLHNLELRFVFILFFENKPCKNRFITVFIICCELSYFFISAVQVLWSWYLIMSPLRDSCSWSFYRFNEAVYFTYFYQ